MSDDTTCVDCGKVYCLYRPSVREWVCRDCWADRKESDE